MVIYQPHLNQFELESFSYEVLANSVDFEWQLQESVFYRGFNLLKNGEWVNAELLFNDDHHYLFSDPDFRVGESQTTIYQLELVKDNFETVLLKEIEIEGEQKTDEISSGFTVWPNPSSGTVHLSFFAAANQNEIEIFNLLGQKIKSFKINADQSSNQRTVIEWNGKDFDHNKVPGGIYFIRYNHQTKKVLILN